MEEERARWAARERELPRRRLRVCAVHRASVSVGPPPIYVARAAPALAPMSFLLSSYAQNRQMEYVICLSHVPEIPSNNPRTPAVRTVFLNDAIMRLSPDA